MKKNFLSIFVFASLLSMPLHFTSCSDDDNDGQPQQLVQQKTSQEAAATIASNLFDYVAAEQAGVNDKNQFDASLDKVKNQILTVLATGNAEYIEQVERFVTDATGLEEETVNALFADTNIGISGIAGIVNNFTAEEQVAILNNASEYLKGYEDGKELASAYTILTDKLSSDAEKEAALNTLEKDIKEHYQTSNDDIYKSTYAKAVAIATGIKEPIVKEVLESEHPKEAAKIAFGISNGGGQTSAQGTADAKEAATLLTSLKGKTVGEILKDNEALIKIGNLKDAYQNGTDEYKESFKAELQSNGVSPTLINMFDSEQDIDAFTVMALLGISL